MVMSGEDYAKYKFGIEPLETRHAPSPVPHWVYKLREEIRSSPEQIYDWETYPQLTGDFNKDFDSLLEFLKDRVYVPYIVTETRRGETDIKEMQVVRLPAGAIPMDLVSNPSINRLGTSYKGLTAVDVTKHAELAIDVARAGATMLKEDTHLITGRFVELTENTKEGIKVAPVLGATNFPFIYRQALSWAKQPRTKLLLGRLNLLYNNPKKADKQYKELTDKGHAIVAGKFGGGEKRKLSPAITEQLVKFADRQRLDGVGELYACIASGYVNIGDILNYMLESRIGPSSVRASTSGILVGISDAGKEENINIVKQSITENMKTLGEKVMVETFPDQGDEISNYEYVKKLAGERRAEIGIPVSNSFIESAVSRSAIDGAVTEFLTAVSRDYFRLTNPDIAKLDETRIVLMNEDELSKILARLSKVLPPAVAQKMLALDAYNMRMVSIAHKIAMPKLSTQTTAFIRESREDHILSMRADSPGEMKLLAEEHRSKMKLAGKEEPPVRLQIRLTAINDSEKQKILSDREVYLKLMDIDDVLKPDDLLVLTKEDADRMTVSRIRESIRGQYGDTYDAKHIAVIDSIREGRSEDIAEGLIFMEYEGIANPRVYDAAIKLIAERPNPQETPPPEFYVSESKRWFILPKAREIDFEQLKREIEHYNEIIRSA